MFVAAVQGKGVKLRDGHVLLSLIMQPNLWLGLHSALWVIRDHVVCLACWKIALRPNPLLSAFHPPPPYFSLLILSLVLPNGPVSCQESAQINKHGSHTSGSESSEGLYIACKTLGNVLMCSEFNKRKSTVEHFVVCFVELVRWMTNASWQVPQVYYYQNNGTWYRAP